MAADFNRDRWGRPLVIPDGGGKPVAYQRFSSHGSILEDRFALEKWKIRTTAVGLAKRDDLYAQIAACPPDDTKRLDDLVAQALEAGGGSVGANMGTALHEFTQRYDEGELALDDINEPWKSDVSAYAQTLAEYGLEPVKGLIEVTLVNDELELAGTADRFYRRSDGMLVCGDLKTGKKISNVPLAYAVQLAGYANSWLYNIETGEREGIDNLDRTSGLIVHVPAGKAECHLYEIDIVEALQAARLASTVKKWQKNDRLVRKLAPPIQGKRPQRVVKARQTADTPVSAPSPHRRHDWAVERINNLVKVCRQELAGLWPEHLPKPSTKHIYTDHEIDTFILPIVNALEAAHELTWPDPDPNTPELERPKPEATKPAEPVIDDGGPEDDIIFIGIHNRIAFLSERQTEWLKTFLEDAYAAGYSLNLTLNRTKRHGLIADAILDLLNYTDGDPDCNELVDMIVQQIRPDNHLPLAKIIGTFTIPEAKQLSQLAVDLETGRLTIAISENQKPTIKEKK